jgi:hypothetical protein
MANRYDRAEILAALWRLGAEEDPLPTSHGILDRALNECAQFLPVTLREGMSFGVTGVGLRCYELPDILLAAQAALLTSEPNPTYHFSVVCLDEDGARQIALLHGLSTETARDIGGRIKASVDRIRRDSLTDAEVD